jgi:hypothetical protein
MESQMRYMPLHNLTDEQRDEIKEAVYNHYYNYGIDNLSVVDSFLNIAFNGEMSEEEIDKTYMILQAFVGGYRDAGGWKS